MGKRLVKQICSILCMTLLLSGCQSDEPIEQETEEVYYLADYQNVEVGCNVNDLCVWDDKAYFVENTGYITEPDLQTKIKVLDMSDFTIDVLPISFAPKDYVSALTVSDEKLYFVKQSINWNEDKTDIEKSDYTLNIYDLQENEVAAIDITNDIRANGSAGEVSYIMGIEVDNDGNIVLTDRTSFLLVYNEAGKLKSQIPFEDEINALLSDENRNVYCIVQKIGVADYMLSKVDVEARQLTEVITTVPNSYEETYLIADGRLYLSKGNMMQSIDMKNREIQDVWDWTEYGFAAGDIKGIEKVSDEVFFAYGVKTQNGKMVMETVRFTQSDVPPVGKTVITYATSQVDDFFTEKAVAEFNRQSREYRVEIIDYSDAEYSTLGTYEQKILNSEMADIINISGGGNFYSLANKGLFADLNAMFEADDTISKDDYFSNVLESYEIEGKLYSIPIQFSVATSVGKASEWDGKTTISLDELLKMAEEDPKMEFLKFPCRTKSMWLNNMLGNRMEQYVDFEKGECYFDSEEFVKELQFANCFPEEWQPCLWEENQLEEIACYRNGKIFIREEQQFLIEKVQRLKGEYDDDVVFVGYPGNNDDRGTITSDFLLGIYEDSENKEGAWEFVKFLLSKEYQSTVLSYYTPLHIEVFEERIQKAMEPNMQKNLDGKEEEVPFLGYYYGDNKEIYIPIYHATLEEVDMYRDVVTNATVRRWDAKIIKIVDEESQAYFSGQKTAEDVADVIQKRVAIYLGEQQ